MVTWEGRMAGGVGGNICVWDAETWALGQTLGGHAGDVMELLVSGQRMISSSLDTTLRVCSLETWACVQTVEVYPVASPQYINCLAVSGSTLVGGSSRFPYLDEDVFRCGSGTWRRCSRCTR